jgi:hypothetical protein
LYIKRDTKQAQAATKILSSFSLPPSQFSVTDAIRSAGGAGGSAWWHIPLFWLSRLPSKYTESSLFVIDSRAGVYASLR